MHSPQVAHVRRRLGSPSARGDPTPTLAAAQRSLAHLDQDRCVPSPLRGHCRFQSLILQPVPCRTLLKIHLGDTAQGSLQPGSRDGLCRGGAPPGEKHWLWSVFRTPGMSPVALALGCEEALPVCGLSFSLSTCFLFLFWPQEEPGVSRRSSGSDVTLRTGDTAQTHTVTQRASFCASPLSSVVGFHLQEISRTGEDTETDGR